MKRSAEASHVEWDFLAEPLELSIEDTGALREACELLKVHRGDAFDLLVDASGVPSKSGSEDENLRLGQILPPPKSILARNQLYSVEIRGYGTRSVTINGAGQLQELGTARELRIRCDDDPSAFRTEWLWNLPTTWIWPDWTERDVTTTISRTRSKQDHEALRVHNKSRGSSRDHMRLEIQGHTLYLGTSHHHAAAPPSGGFLECPPDMDDALVETVLHCASFALGRPVASLGHTEFDGNGGVRRAVARAPALPGGAGQIGRAEMPPADVAAPGTSNMLNGDLFQDLLSKLVDSYETLGLRRIFWLYWNSAVAALDMQGVGYGATLEALRRSSLKVRGRKTSEQLLSVERWRRLFDELRRCVRSHAEGADDSDREAYEVLTRKIGSLNSRSLGLKIQSFFDELGLEIGEVEEGALAERNPSGHGGARSHGWEVTLLRLRALRTLVNRAVLACAGFDGAYVDYSTYDFPKRPLSGPLGGPNGDGVSA